MQDHGHDYVIMKCNVVCVRRAWTEHVPQCGSLQTLRWSDLSVFTLNTASRVKYFVVCLVFLVFCPALSFSALLLGGRVSSFHRVTPTLQRKLDDPEHQLPLRYLPLPSFQVKLFPQKHLPPPPHPFFRFKLTSSQPHTLMFGTLSTTQLGL